MNNIQNVKVNSGTSLTQDFSCSFSDYKFSLPMVKVSFLHSSNKYEQTLLLPVTINKFMISVRIDKEEFLRRWKALHHNKLTLEDRRLNKRLFSSVNELKEVFDNTIIVKNDPHRGRVKLGLAFELPDKHMYMLEMTIYENVTKFDLKMTSNSPNKEYLSSALQTFAFLFNH